MFVCVLYQRGKALFISKDRNWHSIPESGLDSVPKGRPLSNHSEDQRKPRMDSGMLIYLNRHRTLEDYTQTRMRLSMNLMVSLLFADRLRISFISYHRTRNTMRESLSIGERLSENSAIVWKMQAIISGCSLFSYFLYQYRLGKRRQYIPPVERCFRPENRKLLCIYYSSKREGSVQRSHGLGM